MQLEMGDRKRRPGKAPGIASACLHSGRGSYLIAEVFIAELAICNAMVLLAQTCKKESVFVSAAILFSNRQQCYVVSLHGVSATPSAPGLKNT